MFAPAARSALRANTSFRAITSASSRRQISLFTPPAQRKRTFKGFALRWGIAIAGIYWYNTSSLFSREPAENWQAIVESAEDNRELPTIDSITAARRSQKATLAASPLEQSSAPATPPSNVASAAVDSAPGAAESSEGAQDLEEEAASQGAFNEETGEINWECPCLGGMAHGPCGPEFREAFSCFVYSKEEPKGVECIERFKHMQDCFRLHPDIYGAELTDDPDEDAYDTEPNVQPAAAPYSGATTPADAVPDANLTATPSSSPTNLAGNPEKPATKSSTPNKAKTS